MTSSITPPSPQHTQDLADTAQVSPVDSQKPLKDVEQNGVSCSVLPTSENIRSDSGRTSPTLADAEKGKTLNVIYVDFEPGDMHNPANWSRRRKWLVTFVASYFTALTGKSITLPLHRPS